MNASLHIAAVLLVNLLGGLGAAWAQGAEESTPWRLRALDEEQGVEVFLRDRSDGLPEFLAVTRVDARLATLVSVIRDRDAMPQWVYRTRKVELLEQPEPTRGLVRVLTGMPWPLSDREAIVAWELQQDPQTLAVVYRGRRGDGRLAPAPGVVRMPRFESSWSFRPLGGGRVEVRFSGYADLGGAVGSGLLAAFVASAAWIAPLETVRGLRSQIDLPRHRDAVVPFIEEPR